MNQSCSARRDLSNAVSHSRIGHWEDVDSRLLVVGSQTASLTPGPSFAHNLGWRCPNCQCEGIFDIYVSRPFQWRQEHLNARCFAPCFWALNIRESRRTPNPTFSKCWASPPHLAKVGVRHMAVSGLLLLTSGCSLHVAPPWLLLPLCHSSPLVALRPLLFFACCYFPVIVPCPSLLLHFWGTFAPLTCYACSLFACNCSLLVFT
jgi:hypothetical protein